MTTKYKRTTYEKTCEYCGQDFTSTKKRQKLCSVQCRLDRNKHLVKVKELTKKENHPDYRLKPCKRCGREEHIHKWDAWCIHCRNIIKASQARTIDKYGFFN